MVVDHVERVAAWLFSHSVFYKGRSMLDLLRNIRTITVDWVKYQFEVWTDLIVVNVPIFATFAIVVVVCLVGMYEAIWL